MGGKLLFLPGEVLQTESREKSEHRSNNELQEVSRGHSTRGKKKSKGKGRTIVSP